MGWGRLGGVLKGRVGGIGVISFCLTIAMAPGIEEYCWNTGIGYLSAW